VVRIAPDEQAVVLRLGRFDRTLEPGVRFHVPLVERLEVRRVTATEELEFGFRTKSPGPPAEFEGVPSEYRMITGDKNLVNLEFVLQYRIGDLRDYLYSLAEPREVIVRDVAQAAMRSVVAQFAVDGVLTEDKGAIEERAREKTQAILDEYDSGIEVLRLKLQDVEPPEDVKDAFDEVARAEQDRERAILEARGYADRVVPIARGEAEEMLNQSRAHRQSAILGAEGEADRFLAVLSEYRKAKDVTRQRLYLEAMEEILPAMEKIILERDQAERVLPHLPVGRRREQP
jgi:membrane protease subunit HflK